jgi:DNA invertase Pin-like site-specific DNA recombinase
MQGMAERRSKGAGAGRRPTRRDNPCESDFELRDGLITQRWMRAVRSVQDGESPEAIARVLGINRSTIYGWLAQYRRALRAAGWHHRRARWMD